MPTHSEGNENENKSESDSVEEIKRGGRPHNGWEWYAVAAGHTTGVMRRLVQSLLTWIYLTFMSSDAMKEAVASYPGFVCQGFCTMHEAESFLRNEEKKKRRKREEEKRQHEEERN